MAACLGLDAKLTFMVEVGFDFVVKLKGFATASQTMLECNFTLMSSQMLLFIKHGCKWFNAILKPWIAKFVISMVGNGEILQFI